MLHKIAVALHYTTFPFPTYHTCSNLHSHLHMYNFLSHSGETNGPYCTVTAILINPSKNP